MDSVTSQIGLFANIKQLMSNFMSHLNCNTTKKCSEALLLNALLLFMSVFACTYTSWMSHEKEKKTVCYATEIKKLALTVSPWGTLYILFLFLTACVNSVSMAVWEYSVYSCIVIFMSGIRRCSRSISNKSLTRIWAITQNTVCVLARSLWQKCQQPRRWCRESGPSSLRPTLGLHRLLITHEHDWNVFPSWFGGEVNLLWAYLPSLRL